MILKDQQTTNKGLSWKTPEFSFKWCTSFPTDMTMEEVREYERATQEATNLKIGTFPPTISITETPLPSSTRGGPSSAPSTPLSTEAPDFLSVPKERPRKKSAPETLTLPDPGRRDSIFKLPSFFSWNSGPQPEWKRGRSHPWIPPVTCWWRMPEQHVPQCPPQPAGAKETFGSPGNPSPFSIGVNSNSSQPAFKVQTARQPELHSQQPCQVHTSHQRLLIRQPAPRIPVWSPVSRTDCSIHSWFYPTQHHLTLVWAQGVLRSSHGA